ncbi:AAA family ATPase [Frankia sp. Cas4]|uniref:AAA family ATPase n=1 Tax=Frankia sp. Cas4 TaxID=3073927 RepID=UPI002AD45899|nr:AAA family ATPase [Frankia sp. Cas4]
MARAVLRELRLTAFKSFAGATLPLAPLTVLTGRNSSGKSNALDGIEVLARLAGGEDLADALDGRRREGGPVRGGSRGCAPHGTTSFQLGCTVAVDGEEIVFDVEVQVEPELRVLSESLSGPAPSEASPVIEHRILLESYESPDGSAAVDAAVYNGKRGRNPRYSFRDSRLLITQLPARLVPQNTADRAVIAAAAAVTGALRGTFHLDPVPHLMRDYVPGRDAELRRTGANLSASLGRLRQDDLGTFNRLVALVREVADAQVRELIVTESGLGDVMLAIREGKDRQEVTPAREMSDGLLRFIAIATALLTSNRGLDIDQGLLAPGGPPAGVLLVIEELENGLHPSQAVRVMRLIQETIRELDNQVIFTTHSPALLNALPGSANDDVIVCYRDVDDGYSHLDRLTDLPGYAEAMAAGRLGDLMSSGRLVRPEERRTDFAEFNRLLGIE